jgi:hypothetical protein
MNSRPISTAGSKELLTGLATAEGSRGRWKHVTLVLLMPSNEKLRSFWARAARLLCLTRSVYTRNLYARQSMTVESGTTTLSHLQQQVIDELGDGAAVADEGHDSLLRQQPLHCVELGH